MRHRKDLITWMHKAVVGTLLFIGVLTVGSTPAFRQKAETIEATAMGTGTQLEENVEIRLIMNDYSTREERQVLVDAFAKGQNQGLVSLRRGCHPTGCATLRIQRSS